MHIEGCGGLTTPENIHVQRNATVHLIATFCYAFHGAGSVRVGFRVIDQGNVDRLTRRALDMARQWQEDPQSFDGPEVTSFARFYLMEEKTLAQWLEQEDESRFTEPSHLAYLGGVAITEMMVTPGPKLAQLLSAHAEEAA